MLLNQILPSCERLREAYEIRKILQCNSENEHSMLYSNDLAYLISFKDKETAQHGLEGWMNTSRFSLAPHKCSQIVFSRVRKYDVMELDLKLYNQKIPKEKEGKFLGLVVDLRLNFGAQIKHISNKVTDRINLMKVLSFDRSWRLNQIGVVLID